MEDQKTKARIRARQMRVTVRELQEARGTKFTGFIPSGPSAGSDAGSVITAEDMQEVTGFTGLDADTARNLTRKPDETVALPMGIVRDARQQLPKYTRCVCSDGTVRSRCGQQQGTDCTCEWE